MGENNCFMGNISLSHSVITVNFYVFYLSVLIIRFLLFILFFSRDHTKNLLVECAASHLKHKKFTVSYGARLTSSSGRILLQSVPGWSIWNSLFSGIFCHLFCLIMCF